MPARTKTPEPQKNMREGFTTGSAVAAAAAAAVSLLFSPPPPAASVKIATPPFHLEGGRLRPRSPERLSVPIHSRQLFEAPRRACAQVIKDGGDDPDATHGLLLEVWAAASADALTAVARDCAPALCPAMEAAALSLDGDVFLSAGAGVGLVTLPGLAVSPGEPAINPEPRRQIAFAAREAALAAGHNGPIHLLLHVPDGEKVAAKTLNSRLGISGGISILGTRGTVRPFSHDAWRATIAQGLDVARALGLKEIALSTGRNSEDALRRFFPDLPPQAFIQAADYAEFSIAGAAKRRFRRIIWGCYAGKLLKLAQGQTYTHAASAPPDLARLAELALEAGAGAELAARLATPPTVRGAFELLERADSDLALNILRLVAKKALLSLRGWAEKSLAGDTPAPQVSLFVFRNNHSLWLRAGNYE